MSDIASGDGSGGERDDHGVRQIVAAEPADQQQPPPPSINRATRALKVPPHSIDAEQSVLGGLMLDNDAWFNVAELVEAGDFYRTQHQIIYESMTALSADDQPLDAVTVSERLQSKGQLEKAGGLAYLAELAESTPGASNVVAYANIVRENSVLRQLIGAANRIAESAFSRDGRPSEELLDLAEQEVFHISEGRLKGGGPEGVMPLLNRAVDRIEKLYASRSAITGLATGFDDLDKKTAGLQPSDLVIVAGRPSMGKTALALNIAEHAAMVGEGAVLVFSMEMPSDQLVLRMLSSLGRIDQSRMRTGDMHEDDWPRFTSAVSQLKDKKLYIDDTPALTPNDLRTRARRVAREAGGLGLIVVDYLQLMRVAGTTENRTNEISEISRSLKAIAKEMRCPMVALSQLNRGLENRTDKRPVMADLRECVVADTLVNLADGRRVRIEDLVGTEPTVLAMDESQRIVNARSDKVWRVGCKPVVRLRLASGREMLATPRHRLFTGRGWLRLEEIRPEDRVALARNLPVAASVDAWSAQRLGLLGHLIGDGSYLSGQPLRYTTGSELNSAFVARAAEEEFGVVVNRHDGRGNWHQLVFSGNGNRWHPKGLNLWLREIGVFNQRSHNKRIPEAVFGMANESLAVLLKHLWATDGCIHVRAEGDSSRVYFSTCSRGLAEDVAALLHRFGIIARLRSIQQGRSPLYNVDVSGKADQLRFLEEIGVFGTQEIQGQRLEKLLLATAANTNVDTLPKEAFEEVRIAMREQGITQRKMASLRGTSYGGSSHFKFAPSHQTMADYAELLDDEGIRRWVDSDLFWDKVTSIEPAGEQDVFDLTVPGPASWLADGIVSHNSGAIEQDADLILFIYRDEVYHPETAEKGVAEIIIGKQRNGPIGRIMLSFIGNLTKFENLAPDRYKDFGPFE